MYDKQSKQSRSGSRRSMAPSERSRGTFLSRRFSSESDEELIMDTLVTIPPDGGWGWVIVLGSFFCNFVADGCIYTFGIFLDNLSKSLNVPKTTIAIANSLMTGFYYISGPLACALINRYGFRLIGIIGGILAMMAFLTSSFVVHIAPFLFLYGFVGGVGFGMIYVPSIVAVGFYFEKWRALATSIAVTGSAMGIIVFPILVEGLLKGLDWRNQFRVIGGFCLITSVLAFTYRPLKPLKVTKNKPANWNGESAASFQRSEGKKPGFFGRIFGRFHNVKYPTAKELHGNASGVTITAAGSISSTSLFVSTTADSSGSMTTILKSSTSKTDGELSTVYEDNKSYIRSRVMALRSRNCTNCCWNCLKSECCRCRWKGCHRLNKYPNRPMYRDDIFYSASLFTVPRYSRGTSTTTTATAVPPSIEYHMSVTRVATQKDLMEHYKCFQCCPEAVKRTLATMLDCSLLRSPAFVLLSLSGFITLLGMYVPFIYLIEKAQECGVSKHDAMYLLSVLGGANAVGRVISGIIASVPHFSPLIVSYVSILICGIATVGSVFIKSLTEHYAYVIIFGLSIACLAALRAPIVVEMLGLEKLTNAFGILMLFQGLAGFSGVPIAGQLVNLTHSYNTCFIFAGTCIIISGIILMPIKYITRWERARNERREAEMMMQMRPTGRAFPKRPQK